MSIFKHQDTGKCLTMGPFGHTLNGRNIRLKDCSNFDGVMNSVNVLNKPNSENYYIKKGNKCLNASDNGEDGTNTIGVTFKNCDNSSVFQIKEDTKLAGKNVPITNANPLEGYLIFNDNRHAYLDTHRLWGKLVTNADHIFHPDADTEKCIMYYRIEDIEHLSIWNRGWKTQGTKDTLYYNDVFAENGRFKCTLKFIVEEYDSNNNALNISTTYILQCNQKRNLLYFAKESEKSSDENNNKIILMTGWTHDYPGNNAYGRGETNTDVAKPRHNFSQVLLGAIDPNNSNNTYYVKVDNRTEIGKRGMLVQSRVNRGPVTYFRFLPKDSIDEFKFMYHYPDKSNHSTVNISSFINPVKKIAWWRNRLFTVNSRDDQPHGAFTFQLEPEAEPFTNMEKIKINQDGSCKKLQEGFAGPMGGQTNLELCDWQAYNDRYPGLNRAFSGDAGRLKSHYIRYGIKERRNCTAFPDTDNCDWQAYNDRYSDLKKAFDGDEDKLERHYRIHGYNEGRDCSPNSSCKIMVEGSCAKIPQPLKCEMQINGNCAAYPHMSDKRWFNDSNYGGGNWVDKEARCVRRQTSWKGSCQNKDVEMKFTPAINISKSVPSNVWFSDSDYNTGNEARNEYECNNKKEVWKKVCNNNKVTSKFQGTSILKASALPDYKEGFTVNTLQEIQDQLTTLYYNIKTNPSSFTTIIRNVNNINVNINESTIGNHPAHGQGTIRNIVLIKSIFNELYTLYNRIKVIINTMKDVYVNLKLSNIFNTTTGRNVPFNLSSAYSTINQTNSLLSQLENLKNKIKSQKERNEPEVDFNSIKVNLEALTYLCEATNYLVSNNGGGSGNVYNKLNVLNVFYDYLSIHKNGTFSLCNQSYIHAQTTSSRRGLFGYNIDKINAASGNGSGIINNDLITFVANSTKYKDSNKTFFDLDFQEIYDVYFTSFISSSDLRPFSSNHVNKLLSSTNYAKNIENGLFYYLINFIKSQQEFSKLHDHKCSTIKFINDILNINNRSDDYGVIVKLYYDNVDYLRRYIHTPDLTEHSYYFIAMKYYGPIMANKTTLSDKASVFAFLYGTLLKKYNKGLVTLDYSNITRLEQYYKTNIYLINKYNNMLIMDFLTKYNNMFSNAKAQAGLVDGDVFIGLNDEQIKNTTIDGFTNQTEGFATRNSASNALFPSRPDTENGSFSGSNIMQNTRYNSGKSLRILDDGFLYDIKGDDTNYQSLDSYYNSYIESSDYTFDPDNTTTMFTCNEAGGGPADPPSELDITFSCGNKSGLGYTGPYDIDAIKSTCDSDGPSLSNCVFNRSMRLANNINEGKLYLVLHNNDSGLEIEKIMIYDYSNEGYKADMENTLERFAKHDNLKQEFKTIVTETETTMELLQYTSDTTGETLMGNEALVSTEAGNYDISTNFDGYFKLIISNNPHQSGAIQPIIQYKPLANLPIYEDNIGVVGNFSGNHVTRNPGSGKRSVTLYNTNDAKYRLGALINESGYIGTDGTYYRTTNDKIKKINDIGTAVESDKLPSNYSGTQLSSVNFKEITNMRFAVQDVRDKFTNPTDVNNEDVLGVFATPHPQDDITSTYYRITNDNIKYLYKNNSTISDSVISDDVGTFYLKKNALNGNNNACVTNAKQTNILTYDEYNALNKGTFTDGNICGIRQVMKTYIDRFNNDRTTFTNLFNNLVNAFNDLNENELKMLQTTKIKVEELNNLVKDYDKMYSKVVENQKFATIVNEQNNEFNLGNKKTEYHMAIAGITSIGALIFLFNYMKKK